MNSSFFRRKNLLSVFAVFLILSSPIVYGDELKVFFGNLHSHTSYSDGSGTPEEAYSQARDVAHMVFLRLLSIIMRTVLSQKVGMETPSA